MSLLDITYGDYNRNLAKSYLTLIVCKVFPAFSENCTCSLFLSALVVYSRIISQNDKHMDQ